MIACSNGSSLATDPLLIIDDFGICKLAHPPAEDLLEVIKCRYCDIYGVSFSTSKRMFAEPPTIKSGLPS
jgi:hypothetical protein